MNSFTCLNRFWGHVCEQTHKSLPKNMQCCSIPKDKGVEVQIIAQQWQQYTHVVECCNVSNKRMLDKQEKKHELGFIMGRIVGEQNDTGTHVIQTFYSHHIREANVNPDNGTRRCCGKKRSRKNKREFVSQMQMFLFENASVYILLIQGFELKVRI